MTNWFLLFFFFAISAYAVKNHDVNVKVVKLPVGTLNSWEIDNGTEYIIHIVNLTQAIEECPPRVEVTCLECVPNSPVLVVVRQMKGVLSWELPFESSSGIHNNTSYALSTSRTLCPYDIIKTKSKGNLITDNSLTISLSTSSEIKVNVSLRIVMESEFILSMKEVKNISVTPTSPRFYVYKFPEKPTFDSVLLKVEAWDDVCMTVSVQHIKCPVFDLERNVQFDGYWQSVTRSSGITIPRSAFPHGFYAVFVVHKRDEDCAQNVLLNSDGSDDREKQFKVTIMPTITMVDFYIGVFAALGVIVGFVVAISILTIVYLKNVALWYPAMPPIDEEPTVSAISSIQQRVRRTPSQITNPRSEETLSLHSDSSLDESEVDFLHDLEDDKTYWRSKGVVFVCDLSRKSPRVLGQKSQRYLWYLITVSIFYFLPVVQLVITYQKVLRATGNENLCYYNFLCAHPLGLLSDFNHVYSNLGYVWLGFLFIMLTKLRERRHRNAVIANKAVDKYYGIPQHYGLFYAMGAALMVEGILSACYHVCPNHQNFQFDTSFMYVISTMCMLKIYHTRHPDVSAGAYATFGVLAATILLGMCGILDGTPAFWSIFTLIHLFTCFMLSVQIYYLGGWRLEKFNCLRILKELYVRVRGGQFRSILPTFPSRFLIILAANIINWVIAILGPMYILGDFASYLLSIFMANLSIYITFYIIMKVRSKERIGNIPKLFILLSIIFWGFSSYFFLNKSISWKLTPAESRLFNQPCKILNFYDNHDIWHFMSAAAMFFSFMMLLTLDDDLLDVPRHTIAVF